jgi:ATP-binding cassette, subfamily B, multidrug efflux pump
MASLSLKLTLLSVILVPFLPFFVNRMSNLIHKKFKTIQETSSLLSNYAQENFAGIRVIKSFTQETNQINDFKTLNQSYVRQNIALAKIEAVFSPTLQTVAGLSVLIVLFFGGLEAINGRISIGTLVAFPFYLGRVLWPMMGLGWTISIFQRSSASMQRLQEILSIKPEIVSPALPTEHPITGTIEFRNVNLVYPQYTDPVLNNINLKIPAGSTIAIMGPLGSGKSSLVNLIPRFFNPSSGDILLDGRPIQNYDLGKLREQIGFVPQEVFLFSENIKENIAFGLEDQVQADIIHAADSAMIHSDINEFPYKYDMLLGERGINLSGGQKQRITIARALIKKPRILILDDCLSSVDINTEESILRRLKDVLKNGLAVRPKGVTANHGCQYSASRNQDPASAGKAELADHCTTIIISHRLSVVKIADIIVFMEKGQVVETGQHDELLARNGRYARFYQYQQIFSDLEKI